jgi:hypothetical protein
MLAQEHDEVLLGAEAANQVLVLDVDDAALLLVGLLYVFHKDIGWNYSTIRWRYLVIPSNSPLVSENVREMRVWPNQTLNL